MPSPIQPDVILAIESSCDETACAVLAEDGTCLAHEVITQQEHLVYGGVVPEIAARAHLQKLPYLVKQAIKKSGVPKEAIKAVAASTGPGLIGGLIVGSNFGKAMAIALDVPFFAINHIEAHALSVRLPQKNTPPVPFPYLLLLVSGGHCACIAVEGVGQYNILGTTKDDAAGEAFDKTAKMLDLPWPGGPSVEKLARNGQPTIALPHPLCQKEGCDFSFSGLKTALARKIAKIGPQKLTHRQKADFAASFQKTTADIIVNRLSHALAMMPQATTLVCAGGVAANTCIRSALKKLAHDHNLPFQAPPMSLCTDNAVMVGWAALEIWRDYQKHHQALPDGINTRPRPRWNLEEMQHVHGA